MATTKRREAEQPAAGTEAPGGAVAPADDRTALDDLADKKTAKEKLPKGFKKRLPGGVTRRVRVVKEEIGKPKGKPYRVQEPDGTETDYDEVSIEGPSAMRRTVTLGSDLVVRDGVALETEAPVLVGRGRRVRNNRPCLILEPPEPVADQPAD